MNVSTNLKCTSRVLGKNDFLLFCSSVNSGHKTTDQADSITLMTIICSKDVEDLACTEYCASDLKHASLN